MREFDDIINLPRPQLKNHTPMQRTNRAAQFGAFRALTGHEDAIKEEARLTETLLEIDREKTEELNRRMNDAKEIIDSRPQVTVTYFVPDEKKEGGKYVKYSGNLRVIDDTLKTLTFTDGTKISFTSIFDFNITKDTKRT